MAYKCFSF